MVHAPLATAHTGSPTGTVVRRRRWLQVGGGTGGSSVGGSMSRRMELEVEVRGELKELARQEAAEPERRAELAKRRTELLGMLDDLASGDHARMSQAMAAADKPGGTSPVAMAKAKRSSQLRRTDSGRSVDGLKRVMSARTMASHDTHKSFRQSHRDLFAEGDAIPRRRYQLTAYERKLCGSYAEQAVRRALGHVVPGTGKPAGTSVRQVDLRIVSGRSIVSTYSVGSWGPGSGGGVDGGVGKTVREVSSAAGSSTTAARASIGGNTPPRLMHVEEAANGADVAAAAGSKSPSLLQSTSGRRLMAPSAKVSPARMAQPKMVFEEAGGTGGRSSPLLVAKAGTSAAKPGATPGPGSGGEKACCVVM